MELKELVEKIHDLHPEIKEINYRNTKPEKTIWLILKPDCKEDPEEIFEAITEMAKGYYVASPIVYYQLKPLEILDKILSSDNFEEVLTELMDYKYQKSYKINISNGKLDININDLQMNSEIFKKIKTHKDKLRFNLHSKNILNIEER